MWTRVTLWVADSEAAQLVVLELFDQGAQGGEVRDAETFSVLEGSAFVPRDDAGAEIIAYFDDATPVPDLEGLLARHPGTRLVGAQPFDDRSWRDSWRQFFAPTRISRRVAVRPSWNEIAPAGDGAVVLVIDPGMAFGTGTHETTRLCVRALDEWLAEHPGASVLDVGCGSGILTMAAHCLGASMVRGIDNDPEAIRVARENWVLNGLGTEDEAPYGVEELARVEPGWDVVVANIISGVLLALREPLTRAVSPGGLLVLSGVLASERDGFVSRFAVPPLALEGEQVLGEWMVFRMRRA
jgi:ribosomal protein L11 methyltransferase